VTDELVTTRPPVAVVAATPRLRRRPELLRGLLGHTVWIARRHLLQVVRQPWLIAINLVQPFLWLLLFSATFQRIADIPGFPSGNYAQYYVPGLIVMTVLLASGWNGLSVLGDMERGTLDRMLTSSANRAALVLGPLAQQAVSGLLPTAIVLALGYVQGAHFSGGLLDVLVIVAALALISTVMAAFSQGVALLVRREESLIAMVNFIVMPLTFLSTAFMPANLVPPWVEVAIRFNPVNWTVDLVRSAFDDTLVWAAAAPRLGGLAALAVTAAFAATSALRRYRRLA
jgi:ABC-2 type transport system permease protein